MENEKQKDLYNIITHNKFKYLKKILNLFFIKFIFKQKTPILKSYFKTKSISEIIVLGFFTGILFTISEIGTLITSTDEKEDDKGEK